MSNAIGESVDILLSTYNGECYLEAQVDSLRVQTYHHLNIIIRDDGSTDGTVDLIKKMVKDDSRIFYVDDEGVNLGPAKSFLRLLSYSKSPFVMFCDQDDVWYKNKVSASLDAMKKMDGSLPCLVHTDLEVVDAQLQTISSSYFERASLPKNSVFSDLLVQNNVTGCTMLFNSHLRNLALMHEPHFIAMHDGWLALLASLYGEVFMLDRPLIKYRQHASNAVGSRNLLQKIKVRLKSPFAALDLYLVPKRQGIELFDSMIKNDSGLQAKEWERLVLKDFLSYCEGAFSKRLLFLFERRYNKRPFYRNFLYRLLFVLSLS